MKKDPRPHTKNARRRVARHPPHRPAPAQRSSPSEALALLVVLLTVAGAVFVFQGSPDLWDMLHARARYGVRWSGVGCG